MSVPGRLRTVAGVLGAVLLTTTAVATDADELPVSAVAAVSDDIGDDDLARFLLVPVFDILDCTSQGFIEAGEVDEHFPVLFNHFDKDLDRTIARSEYVGSRDSRRTRLQARMFDEMDSNSDGVISPREYRAQVIRLIDAVDYDGDGEVTPAELKRDLKAEAELNRDLQSAAE